MGHRRRRVAVTGATGDLGRLLLPRLQADPDVEKVISFDVSMPRELSKKFEFRRLDLTNPAARDELLLNFNDAKVDAIFHLAFVTSRVHGAAFAHELEVIGSMNVLAAAGQQPGVRLVLPSLTALYGAQASAPAFWNEQSHLRGCKGSRYINDKVEVEQQFASFRERHPQADVVVLRFAPVVGPTSDNPLTRLLRTRLIPTLLGYDPLWQLLHEDDAAQALHRALQCAPGIYNVAAHGVMPLSSLVKLAGGQALPLPPPLVRGLIAALEGVGVSSVPVPLLEFLRYSCVADARPALKALDFLPRHSIGDAVRSLKEAVS